MVKFPLAFLLLTLLSVAYPSSGEVETAQHNIDTRKITYAEVIYFKKFNGVLRPFPYDSESSQLKNILRWLKSNKNGWTTLEKNTIHLNDMDIAVSFYTDSGTELGTTLWLDATKVVLSNETEDTFRLLSKQIFQGELIGNP